MNMSNNECDSKKCSRCHSLVLLKYFSVNRKGNTYKCCDNCRHNVVKCDCGKHYSVNECTKHKQTQEHKDWWEDILKEHFEQEQEEKQREIFQSTLRTSLPF